jgi:hypothetical protein
MTYPLVRKRKYSLEYYLEQFKHVLLHFSSWHSLQLLFKNTEKENHYKTIYNEFNRWSKDDIFEKAYYKFISENYFKLSHVNKNKTLNLFIDVTKINNKYGVEKIGINCEYKKKNITAIQLICDNNKIPLGISYLDNKNIKGQIYKSNKKINKDDKPRITSRSTIEHELIGIQKTLDIIPSDIRPYKNVKLVGDKGYISKNKYNIFDKTVKIITPIRKNEKRKNTKKEIDLLDKRHKVENIFASLKASDRIYVRKDKKIKNYMSFFYMDTLLYVLNSFKILDNELFNTLAK